MAVSCWHTDGRTNKQNKEANSPFSNSLLDLKKMNFLEKYKENHWKFLYKFFSTQKQVERWTDIMNRNSQFWYTIKMRKMSTEDLKNSWPSYRQWNPYHITVSQVNTAKHAALYLTEMIWLRKFPISNITLKFSHPKFHCCTVGLHFLLHHYNCIPETSNLLQLQKAQWSDEYSVHKINTDMHSMCELHVTVKVFTVS